MKFNEYYPLYEYQSALFAASDARRGDENVSTGSSNIRVLLDWNTILRRFSDFLMSTASSVVLGVSQAEFKKRNYISVLLSTINLLDPTASETAAPDHTLISELRKRGSLITTSTLSIGEEDITLSKQLWVNQVLLAKDLFIMLPELVPTHLTILLDSIITSATRLPFSTDNYAFLFAPKCFPDAKECMFILVLSQICASVIHRATAANTVR